MATNAPTAPHDDHDALPAGTRFGELEILRVLGVGGFGIVYLAQDHALERRVALKEYMPGSLASRGKGGYAVSIRSGAHSETYALGLRSFVNEARLLARFNHPSLVKVYRFWEQNGTAYMVMPYLEGRTLRDVRRSMSTPPTEQWMRSVIDPMLDALELLHGEDVYHRDIAPDNILLPPGEVPVLLDFGAARRAIGDRTQTFTAILKPSYAPIEQYAEAVQLRQGPWTDLYALGAVVYYLLRGVPPAPATARAVQDEVVMLPREENPGVSQAFLDAIEWAMAVRPVDRPQNIAELRAVLEGRATVPPRTRAGSTAPQRTVVMPAAAGSAATAPPGTTNFAPTMPAEEAARLDAMEATRVRPAPQFAALQADDGDSGYPPVGARTGPPSVFPMPLEPAQPRTAPRAASRRSPADEETVMPSSATRDQSRSRRLGMSMVAGLIAVVGIGATAAWMASRPAAKDAATTQAAPGIEQPAAIANPAAPLVAATPATASPATAPVTGGVVNTNSAVVTGAIPAASPTDPADSLAKGKPRTAAIHSLPAHEPASATATEPAPTVAAHHEEPPHHPVPRREESRNAAAAETATHTAPAAASPRDACGARVFLALAVCMEEQCERPRFKTHPQCDKVRAIVERRRRGESGG